MRFLTLSLLACITGLTFCEVFKISSGVTTCLKVTSFSKETNSSELTALTVVIISWTRVICIEATGIGSICIGDYFIRAISIEFIANTSFRDAGIRGTN